MRGWQPNIQDSWSSFTGGGIGAGGKRGGKLISRVGGTTPPWGTPKFTPSWGESISELGYTGEGAPKFEEEATQPAITPWQQWQPYFEGLGINILPGGEMTATSEAFRQRMLPDALQAMMDYYQSLGRPWEDYLGYSQGFMPRTPSMGARRWMPSGLWRR